MDKALVKSLLRILRSPEDRFASSKALAGFVEQFNVGRTKGASLVFDEVAKASIRDLLRADGIDPQRTLPEDWHGLTRSESLALGNNEKWAVGPVKRDRVAIKTLPGRALLLGDAAVSLPARCHLDVEWPSIWGTLRHDSILMVENWECFNCIDVVSIDLRPAGGNPLVVWRGDKNDTRTDAALAMVKALRKPIWAFVDYDPAGLAIAQALPLLSGIVRPDPAVLEALLKEHGLEERYRPQLPAVAAFLDSAEHPDIVKLWLLLKRIGKGLPQEHFISRPGSGESGLN